MGIKQLANLGGSKWKCWTNKYVFINNTNIINGTHMDICSISTNGLLFKYLGDLRKGWRKTNHLQPSKSITGQNRNKSLTIDGNTSVLMLIVISLSIVVTLFLRDSVQNYIPMRKPPQGHTALSIHHSFLFISKKMCFPFGMHHRTKNNLKLGGFYCER